LGRTATGKISAFYRSNFNQWSQILSQLEKQSCSFVYIWF